MKKNMLLVFVASMALASGSAQAAGIKAFFTTCLGKTTSFLGALATADDVMVVSNTTAMGLTIHQAGESVIGKLKAQGTSSTKVAAAQVGLRIATVLASIIAATKIPCNKYTMTASGLTILAPIGYNWYQSGNSDDQD